MPIKLPSFRPRRDAYPPDLRCEKPRNHTGNHRAFMHGSDVQLASDGHTVTATGWPVEWQDAEPAAAEAA